MAPGTAAIEYVTDAPLHTATGPVMAPGDAVVLIGNTASFTCDTGPQGWLMFTRMVSGVALPTVTVMLLVVDEPVHPAGRIHV